MTDTKSLDPPFSTSPLTVAPSRRWSWPHYLAIVAVPILIWNAWTVIAWLADGPHEITQFQTRGSANWYTAHSLEALCILASIPVLVIVVRDCWRQRRLFTFDAMFLLCGFTLFWGDYGVNFLVPNFTASSNFVNLNNTCGHMPFVINPDCGRGPDPILLFVVIESFVPLGLAMLAVPASRWIRRRWPGISTLQLIIVIFAVFVVFDALFEPAMIALRLWTYASPSGLSLGLGSGLRWPITEIGAGFFYAMLVCVRLFKDDKGRTFVERGLDRHKPRTQTALTFLALYVFMQFTLWGPASVPDLLYTPYETVWSKMPAYLLNDLCDAPGVYGTRYGPCPGSPGFRIPGRHSLPGRSP